MAGAEVETIKPTDIKVGDVLWAPGDGDWFEVARIGDGGFDTTTVYRAPKPGAERHMFWASRVPVVGETLEIEEGVPLTVQAVHWMRTNELLTLGNEYRVIEAYVVTK